MSLFLVDNIDCYLRVYYFANDSFETLTLFNNVDSLLPLLIDGFFFSSLLSGEDFVC